MKESRVLPSTAVTTIADYTAAGGGAALERFADLGPDGVLDGRKWAAVRGNASELERSAVVVNAAEGEPGSFKDRAIIRANPYAIVEGALVAARCLGADQLIIGTKRTFTREIALLRAAIAEPDRYVLEPTVDGVRGLVVYGPDGMLGHGTARRAARLAPR